MMSLYLGLFNLLPAFPLDGGRVLFNVVAEHFGLDAAECATMISGGVCAGLIAGVGAIAAIEYMNFTILFGAVWLLFTTTRNRKIKSAKK
jgi:stage IV sporulation protein FB